MRQIPGSIEHAQTISEEIWNVQDISVVWVALANAYDSVSYAMIEKAMEFFWLPEKDDNHLKKDNKVVL